MTKARSAVACPREPIGLRLEEAAAYVGVSASRFGRLVEDGVMPVPRKIMELRIWDADELLQAFRRAPRDYSDLRPGVDPLHDDVMTQDLRRMAPRA